MEEDHGLQGILAVHGIQRCICEIAFRSDSSEEDDGSHGLLAVYEIQRCSGDGVDMDSVLWRIVGWCTAKQAAHEPF